MRGYSESAAPNIGAMMLDICRPDGPAARLTVLLASIENARLRIIRASYQGLAPDRIATVAMEEFAKVANAAELYRNAAGLPEPIERVR